LKGKLKTIEKDFSFDFMCKNWIDFKNGVSFDVKKILTFVL